LKSAIIQDDRHMGYMAKSDWMTNTYSISRQSGSGQKKLFFHQLDFMILGSYILITCGSKLSHRNFQLSLARDLLERCFEQGLHPKKYQPFPPAWGCQAQVRRHGGGFISSLEKNHSQTAYKCVKCDAGLNTVPCFQV
jgi:hypothetical protein